MAQNNIAAMIHELENMGYVDGQLALCYSLEEPDGNFFGDFIRLFCREASSHLYIMEEILNDDVVQYNHLLYFCHKFQDASQSFGAVKMADICTDLCEVCTTDCSKYWCTILVSEFRSEFHELKEHLDQILQFL